MERRGYESINAELANAQALRTGRGRPVKIAGKCAGVYGAGGRGRAPAPHVGERLHGASQVRDARRALYDSGWRRNVSASRRCPAEVLRAAEQGCDGDSEMHAVPFEARPPPRRW